MFNLGLDTHCTWTIAYELFGPCIDIYVDSATGAFATFHSIFPCAKRNNQSEIEVLEFISFVLYATKYQNYFFNICLFETYLSMWREVTGIEPSFFMTWKIL